MNYQFVINQAEDFVRKYMQEHENPGLLFHNFLHTRNTVSVTGQIATHYELKDKELFIVIAAAWFLHSGYYEDILHPEEASIKIADTYFKNSGIDEETIQSIKKCMLAAKIPLHPRTILEQVIWDADSFYLGTENFPWYNKLRKKEFELLNNVSINKNDWRKSTIQLFEGHEYYSDYCKELLNKKKIENLQKLREKDLLATSLVNPITTLPVGQTGTIKKSEKNKKAKKNSPDRTIETMFRTASGNSQRLSNQADTKAHIMISVNAIIISVLLSMVVRGLADYSRFIIPLIMLLLVSLVTIIFSILATKPNIPDGTINQNDLNQNNVNLLFFGNFLKMSFDDYCKSMMRVMSDRQFLYLTMLRNLHEHGIVLGKKYRLLKTAYNVFMYGLIISIIAFFIASGYFSGKM